ncbi:MAG TPA: IPTL-CTERM sorting domain-containing protein [Bacteroidales bacterium]|nr:IPTL-CTERM sorting domain-containing protein [Bacteroidales bacterium]HPS61898.1 IPTL-CTERM sorting domain-containing protein [Bacteroidales bacterium]
MKKITLLIASVMMATIVFAQIPTIHNPNAPLKVTKQQIQSWGAASQKDNAGSVIFLDFEGLDNLAAVGNYYNGGLGPNYGVYFGGNTLAIIDEDAGGSGNFANEPSPSTVMFFLDGAASTMNVPAGFTTGFSFYYCAYSAVEIYVYDGLDGTGNLIASQTLPGNWQNNGCTGDPTGAYCNWDAVGISFPGTAKSVLFTGAANNCAFDNVTFGSTTPGPAAIPTLSQWGLIIFGIALLGMGTFFLIRRRS